MEVALLAKLQEKDLLEQFLHHVIDHVCGRKVNFLASYVKIIPAFSLKELVDVIDGVIREFARTSATKDEISKKLESLSIPGPIAAVMTSCINARLSELKASAINQITQISQLHLADFDWKVQLSWSSSKISNLREPHLLLSLMLKDSQSAEKELIFELNREELDHVIKSLEAANQARLRLKA